MRAGSIAIGSIAIGVGFLILSLLFIHQASLLPGPLAEGEVGPARFPYILGGIGALLAVVPIVQEWLRRTRAEAEAEAFSWRSLAMIGPCVAYVAAIPWFGYYVATLVWLGAALLIPLTYTMPPAISLLLLIALYMGAEYGGSIRSPGRRASPAVSSRSSRAYRISPR